MRVSDAGLQLIARFEGFVPYLYNDPANATVGYGLLVHMGPYHQARGVDAECDRWPRRSDPPARWLTEAQGWAMLQAKVTEYANAVEQNSRPLKQQEFDALTSFCYNVGQGGYIHSSVRSAVNSGGDVCAELRRYVTAGGVVYQGLVMRRQAECAMFYGPAPNVQEDEVFHRMNGVGGSFWKGPDGTGVVLGDGQDLWAQLGIDFPALPADAKACDLEMYLDPAYPGRVTYFDGDGQSYAGVVGAYGQRHEIIKVVPINRRCRMLVQGGPVKVAVFGIVGWYS